MNSSSSVSGPRSRKRKKVRCTECRSCFDSDYKKRHEVKCHGGKKIRVEDVGAPLNPFQAAASNKSKTLLALDAARNNELRPVVSLNLNHLEDEDKSDDSAFYNEKDENSDGHEFNHEFSACGDASQNNTEDKSRDFDANEVVVDEFRDENDVEQEQSEENEGGKTAEGEPLAEKQGLLEPGLTISDDQEATAATERLSVSDENPSAPISWLSCAGQLAQFCDIFEDSKHILSAIKESEVPNPEMFLVQTIAAVQAIIDMGSTVLQSCNNALQEIQKNQGIVSDSQHDFTVDHDPGKRKNISSDSERNYLISLGPHQPKLSKFPANPDIPKNKQMRFSATWYKEYPHLEYSTIKDAAFCFVCGLFPNGPNRENQEEAWISVGVRKWHKMKSSGAHKNGKKTGKLAQHFSCTSHKAALSDFCAFIVKSNHVDVMLDKTMRAAKIQEEQDLVNNTEAVKILVDVARTLARQGLALRGHDESHADNGNFIQIVKLLAKYCPLMKHWLDNTRLRPYHVTYLSPNCQNEFLNLLAANLRCSIKEEIQNADFFSIMADTTPDSSHKDRLVVNVRYVDQTGRPKERLLQILEAKDKTGAGMAQQIVNTITDNEIDLKKLAFQSYDFASSMSGQFQGAQRKLSDLLQRDIPYIPCQAHRINTFLGHSCDNSTIIAELFNILEELYVFFSASTKRFSPLLEKMTQIENSLLLRNLSKTRWTARAESVKSVWTSLDVIIEVLSCITQNSHSTFDAKTKSKASGLLKKILDFDFIVCIMFMKNLIYKLKNLTEQLEAEELNIIDAVMLMEGTIASMRTMRSDTDSMDKQLASSKACALKLGIDPESDFSRHHRRRLQPNRIDSRAGNQATFDLEAFYRREFTLVLDKLLLLMSDNLKSCISTIEPLFLILKPPVSTAALSDVNITNALKYYPTSQPTDVDAFKAEVELLANYSSKKSKISEVTALSETMKTSLPLANKFCRLVATSPVTVASSERTFSKMKFVKNYLRSTMSDIRLDNLLLLSCEKDLTDAINPEAIVSKWAILKQRRVKVNV